MKTNQVATYEFEIFKKFSSHDILPAAEAWVNTLRNLPGARRVKLSGELRRGKASISHIDIVLESDHPSWIKKDLFALPSIERIVTTSNDHLELRIQNDITLYVWLATPQDFTTVLFYTTGPETYTDKINNLAAQVDVQITYHGIWKEGHLLNVDTEAEIFHLIKLQPCPPELRDQPIEISDYPDLQFGNLIHQDDIRSDLHTHTDWSDGKNSIEEMVCAAMIRHLSAIAITDHSPNLLRTRYDNYDYLDQQFKAIQSMQTKYESHITILRGVEVDIMPDGSLDLPDNKLSEFDVVVASLHVELDQPQDVITSRLIHAIENPCVDIIGHPGGRLYPMHDFADLDWDRVIQAAAFNKVALEINSHKAQPIFDDQKARMAAAAGAPICLNSDAHSTSMLDLSKFGINIARRAGLKKSQVINTWSPKRLEIWLDRKIKTIAAAQ